MIFAFFEEIDGRSAGQLLVLAGFPKTERRLIDKCPKAKCYVVALGTERNSAMNRSGLADLNAFVAVADHLSFRAA